jgi:hypothetical protein
MEKLKASRGKLGDSKDGGKARGTEARKQLDELIQKKGGEGKGSSGPKGGGPAGGGTPKPSGGGSKPSGSGGGTPKPSGGPTGGGPVGGPAGGSAGGGLVGGGPRPGGTRKEARSEFESWDPDSGSDVPPSGEGPKGGGGRPSGSVGVSASKETLASLEKRRKELRAIITKIPLNEWDDEKWQKTKAEENQVANRIVDLREEMKSPEEKRKLAEARKKRSKEVEAKSKIIAELHAEWDSLNKQMEGLDPNSEEWRKIGSKRLRLGDKIDKLEG